MVAHGPFSLRTEFFRSTAWAHNGLTCYCSPNVKAIANYITGAVSGTSQNGRLRLFEAWFEVDF
jgi:hypothetical protein